MNRLTRWTLSTLIGALCVTNAALAAFDPVGQDTDIFMANPAYNATRPNVLILLDNTANWNTPFSNEKSALVSVVNGLNENYNVGLMMFPETGSPNDNVDGGYIRFATRQMTGTNRSALSTIVNNLDINGDKGNNATFSLLMYEAYAYFAGITARAGFGKVKRDFPGNTANNVNAASLGSHAFSSSTSSTYVSPIVDGCQKNFIIVISNGPASDNTSSLSTAQTLLSGLTGQSPPSTITISPNGSQNNWMDEFAKFMAEGDCNSFINGKQSVVTYTVDVDPITTGQGPSHTALLKSAATNGKGKYFQVTAAGGGAQITTALQQIFQEIQAVNSVFAAVTLPVSVNVRGTNLNQVYIGVFRPDAQKSPRWLGNLKLYNLGVDSATDQLFLADANGTRAENATTGFITNTAKSYWTSSSSFWSYRTPYETGDIGQQSDSPDGDLVEKGGAAQRLRVVYPTSTEIAGRKVYTCLSCATNSLLSASAFNDANTAITAGLLGTYTTKSVTSITSAGTTATATVTGHGFSTGNTVTITNASPSVYNGDFTITVTDANTFTYTLTSAPSATTGTSVATGHNLNTNDLVEVTLSVQGGYNVTNAAVTRVDANTFTYPLSASVTGASSGHVVMGKKLLSTLIGSGTTATATVPSHGYSTGNLITIENATPAEFNVSNRSITVTGTDTFTYTTTATVPGSSSTGRATLASHGYSTGDTLTIAGATPSEYNGTVAITVLDTNTFTYTLSGAVSSGATGTITATKNFNLTITSITHPTSGSGNGAGCGARDVATVTTNAAHGLTAGVSTVTLSGTGYAVYNKTFTVQSVPAPTQFTIGDGSTADCTIDSAPSSVTSSGMIATSTGVKTITSITGVISATGSITSGRLVSPVTSISTQTNATGTILAGRKTDADATGRTNLINWVRGVDNAADENANLSSTDVRASVHGDVLHSRPAVVNYNRNGDDNDVFIYYGGNDGLFHALQGGFGTTGGNESWSFVAQEFLGRLKRLRDNTPLINQANPRDYFFDGPIGIYTKDANSDSKLVAGDGDKVYLYAAMRRGGRYIYALDVSDPATPKFMWKRGCPNLDNNTGCDTGFEALGQTWSEPKIAYLRAFANPVLIFGAGYDPMVEDFQPCLTTAISTTQVTARTGGSVTYTSAGSCTHTGTSSTTVNRTIGRGIFIVDATNGALLTFIGPSSGTGVIAVPEMTYAMPADTVILNRDRDTERALSGRENVLSGYVDRIYAVDTGGNVWRVDVDSASTSSWVVTKLAAISGTGLTNQRKFLFPPDVVYTSDANGNYDAVLVGSGDREHAFDATVVNRFYMFKDRKTGLDATGQATINGNDFESTSNPNGLFDATSNCLQDVEVCNTAQQEAAAASLLAARGWFVTLGAGEKVISSATTSAGTTFFNTNQPSGSAGGGSCGANLGIAREYLVGFKDATAATNLNAVGGLTVADRSSVHAGGGFLPSPVPVIVQIGDKRYQAVISGTSVRNPGGLTLGTRVRTYWNRRVD